MATGPVTRWQTDTGGRSGASYAARFDRLARARVDLDGEARLVHALAPDAHVLDAGCGTGRIAVSLARRGHVVTGVDADGSMLAVARRRWPHLHWWEADLASFDLHLQADVVLAAGNVMVYLQPGTEAKVLQRLSAHLRPGGLLVAGFVVRDNWFPLDTYDRHAADAGLTLVDRWATWDRQPYRGGGYAVSVSRRG